MPSREGHLVVFTNSQRVWITENHAKVRTISTRSQPKKQRRQISNVACQQTRRNHRTESDLRVFICTVRVSVLMLRTDCVIQGSTQLVALFEARWSNIYRQKSIYKRCVERPPPFSKTDREIPLGAISTEKSQRLLRRCDAATNRLVAAENRRNGPATAIFVACDGNRTSGAMKIASCETALRRYRSLAPHPSASNHQLRSTVIRW